MTFDLFTARSSLLPYAFVWEKCSEFQMTSSGAALGQCCSNFIWSLPGAGEWKIAKMVVVHCPRWQLSPYIVKCFKNHLIRNQINGHTLTFDLFTLRSSLHPYAYVWEKCSEFQMTSPLEPLGQCCSNFIWSLPGAGEWKIAKIVAVQWPRWLPCPYMVKTFKNLLLQDRGCLVAESLHKSSGTGGVPKLLKWWLFIDIWPFYGEIKFASICIFMSPIHLYGKNVDNLKWPPLKPLGPYCSNFMWSLLGVGEQKIAKLDLVHWSKLLSCPYMVKTFKNLLQNQISPGT